jgi:hypothetical protein
VITLLFVVDLTLSSASAKNVTVTNLFVKVAPNGTTTFNGTANNLTGTDEEITNQYFELGEQFSKKVGTDSKEPVTYIFKNNTRITVPFEGYKSVASDALIKDVLKEPEAIRVCWMISEGRDGRIHQQHFVCDFGPGWPP